MRSLILTLKIEIQKKRCLVMKNDLREIGVTRGGAGSRGVFAAIFITSVLLLLSMTFSAGSQTSPGSAAQSMATVPSGTRLMVKMIDSVDSETNQQADVFRGTLEANLMAGDAVVAPKGTPVFGRLLTASSSGRTSGGELELDITDIKIDGRMFSLQTSSNQMEGQSGSSVAGQTARGSAKGAAAGAIVGAGAGFGARAGAIAGNVVGTTSGEKVKVPAGSLVEFTLDHPVSLPVAK
jgi:hypothetical protein